MAVCGPAVRLRKQMIMGYYTYTNSRVVGVCQPEKLFSRRGQQPYGRRLGLETIAPSAMFCLYL